MPVKESSFKQIKSVNYFNLRNEAYKCEKTGYIFRYAKGLNERLKAMIAVIVVAGLFHTGWMTIRLFMRVMQGKEDDIEVVLIHKKPALVLHEECVGMATVSRKQVQVYIRKEFRRKGLGSSAIAFLKEQGSVFDYAITGERGSKNFWKQNQVKMPYD